MGGDYYDAFEVNGRRLGLAIGDVSGKGISAALLMASLSSHDDANRQGKARGCRFCGGGVRALIDDLPEEVFNISGDELTTVDEQVSIPFSGKLELPPRPSVRVELMD